MCVSAVIGSKSTVVLDSVVLVDNVAVGSGYCSALYDVDPRCPLAIGGAIAIQRGVARISKTLFERNSVRCSSTQAVQCRASGGGLGVTGGGSDVRVDQSLFALNYVDCHSSCDWGSGGAFFGNGSPFSNVSFLECRQIFFIGDEGTSNFSECSVWRNSVSGLGSFASLFLERLEYEIFLFFETKVEVVAGS